MKLNTIIATTALVLSVSACSSVNKVVYRIDVPQGNYLETSAIKQVQAGMSKEQVQYLLGTPVLNDPFSNNTWYYVYLQQHSYQEPQQHTFVVKFDQKGKVIDTALDKPLNDVEKQTMNNVIIEAPNSQKKSWWKFW